jgi:cytochrome c553
MMIKQALFLVAALSLGAAAHAAGNAAEGQKKSTTCAACHGPDGNTPVGPDFPKLAGQHQDYLFKVLNDYKSGARKNAIMSGQAANLSRQDMQDLAAYFSSMSGSLHIVPISRLKGSGH